MQILLSDPTYGRPSSEFSADFLEQLEREASAFDGDFRIEERNFGHGADWPMYLLTFAAAFLSGATINENVDGWFSLAKKFRKFCAWLRGKQVGYWVDDEASALVALEAIREAHLDDVDAVERANSAFILAASTTLAGNRRPDFQPVGVYVHCYRASNSMIVIVVVNSDGTVESVTPVVPQNPFNL